MGDDIIALLKAHEYFFGISDDTLREIADIARVSDYTTGAIVHQFEEPLTSVCFVLRGRLKAVRIDAQGREHFFRMFERGDQYGIMLAGLGEPLSVRIFALESSTILTLDHEASMELMFQHPDLRRQWFQTYARSVRQHHFEVSPRRAPSVLVLLHESPATRNLAHKLVRRLRELARGGSRVRLPPARHTFASLSARKPSGIRSLRRTLTANVTLALAPGDLPRIIFDSVKISFIIAPQIHSGECAMLKNHVARIALVLAASIGAAVAVAQIVGSPAKKMESPAGVQTFTAPAKPNVGEPAQAAEALMAAFNRGSAGDVAALFVPNAELTDDAGNVHKGRQEIEKALTSFFEKFPGTRLQQKITSSRSIAPSLEIQDGQQTIVTKDGKEKSESEFTATLVRLETGWAYATLQQTSKDEEPSLHDRLEPLSWLVGDWVDEAPDASMTFSCRWSEDHHFLLVNYESRSRGKSEVNSTQRIGWDPLTERVRSWVFDSDGGYGEGQWTRVDKSWIIKSTAVMPDGQTGSATIVLEPVDRDRFIIKGLDRIFGDSTLPDYQAPIVRKPPKPAQ
jgi:uncharacterized protein (TIGR02246 family)